MSISLTNFEVFGGKQVTEPNRDITHVTVLTNFDNLMISYKCRQQTKYKVSFGGKFWGFAGYKGTYLS